MYDSTPLSTCVIMLHTEWAFVELVLCLVLAQFQMAYMSHDQHRLVKLPAYPQSTTNSTFTKLTQQSIHPSTIPHYDPKSLYNTSSFQALCHQPYLQILITQWITKHCFITVHPGTTRSNVYSSPISFNNALTEPSHTSFAVGSALYGTSNIQNSTSDPFDLTSIVIDCAPLSLWVLTSRKLSPANDNKPVPNSNTSLESIDSITLILASFTYSWPWSYCLTSINFLLKQPK